MHSYIYQSSSVYNTGKDVEKKGVVPPYSEISWCLTGDPITHKRASYDLMTVFDIFSPPSVLEVDGSIKPFKAALSDVCMIYQEQGMPSVSVPFYEFDVLQSLEWHTSWLTALSKGLPPDGEAFHYIWKWNFMVQPSSVFMTFSRRDDQFIETYRESGNSLQPLYAWGASFVAGCSLQDIKPLYATGTPYSAEKTIQFFENIGPEYCLIGQDHPFYTSAPMAFKGGIDVPLECDSFDALKLVNPIAGDAFRHSFARPSSLLSYIECGGISFEYFYEGIPVTYKSFKVSSFDASSWELKILFRPCHEDVSAHNFFK